MSSAQFLPENNRKTSRNFPFRILTSDLPESLSCFGHCAHFIFHQPCNSFSLFILMYCYDRVARGGGGGGGGGSNKVWDRETMFSQLAKGTARQRLQERAGNFSAVISAVSAARVQCCTIGSNL